MQVTLLSQLRHPNVVHFYGVLLSQGDVYIVTE